MSHSQFHSTEAFILRHAWLSLWDKHMTTGRINQVTIRARDWPTESPQGRRPLQNVQRPAFGQWSIHQWTVDCRPSQTSVPTASVGRSTTGFPYASRYYQLASQSVATTVGRQTVSTEQAVVQPQKTSGIGSIADTGETTQVIREATQNL